jgi:hypothetical protein
MNVVISVGTAVIMAAIATVIYNLQWWLRVATVSAISRID